MITFDLTIVICDRAVLIANDNESDFISVEKIGIKFSLRLVINLKYGLDSTLALSQITIVKSNVIINYKNSSITNHYC